MNIVILIATYNESNNIDFLLNQLKNYDVVVVDDNSPDGTANICKQFSNVETIIRIKKRGIASAYIDGFKYLIEKNKHQYIIQMDAGLTHNPKDVQFMIQKAIDNNYDLVIGSRNINQVSIKNFRTILSKTALFLVYLLGIKQSDVTSGFRCWKTELLKKLPLDSIKSKGFSFQWELLYYCKILKSNIGEYSIDYKLTNSSLNLKIIIESLKLWLYYLYLDKLTRKKK